MNKGVLIFANNNRQIDYAKMAVVSGSLAAKHLKVPVSLATDETTVAWMKQSGQWQEALTVFDKIISKNTPQDLQQRKFFDGPTSTTAPFKNSTRPSAWYVTPYERTLLIDCDYFIMSDALNEYWEVDSPLLISDQYNDIQDQSRAGWLDSYVSDTGVKLLWATTVMFTKNDETKIFFDLVEHIRKNYRRFADVYRFDNRIYRNDIAFGIAKHILYGFETDKGYSLPSVLSVPDQDMIVDVENGAMKVLSKNLNDYTLCSIKDRDIHLMNKQAVLRNLDKIKETL